MPSENPPERDLTRHQVRALQVAGATAILAIAFCALSRAHEQALLMSQLTALGGIAFALLVEQALKSPKWTLRVATIGLVLGATLPWLYRMAPPSLIRSLFENANLASSGMFSFGTAFLVKSAEARR